MGAMQAYSGEYGSRECGSRAAGSRNDELDSHVLLLAWRVRNASRSRQFRGARSIDDLLSKGC